MNYSPTKPLISPEVRGITRHDKYMNMLSRIAIAVQPVARARIAACVIYKNEVISFGINQKKSHPFQAIYGTNKESIFLHAETDAIKNALKVISVNELTKSSLYICRVKYEACNKNKFIFGLAKPCPGCSRAIANFGIKNVFYSLDGMEYCKL